MKRYTQNEIDKLANILKNDGVICVPTDTVYGICARINSEKARDNLALVKNRPSSKSFAIMCADENQIKTIGIVNEKIEKLIYNFMPGHITLIFLKSPNVPSYIYVNCPEICVRMETSETLKDLIIKTGSPIFMTSANQSGASTCTSLDEIEKNCPTLDGIMEGNVFFGKESTIVDCTSETFKILREGPISMEQITKALEK